ncbi:MAG: aldolase [Rickettsiales bacterium]|nr:aldolase [Rickettsiales bacterium]
MIHDPPALTIHRGFKRPSKELVEKFRGAQTSHLADAMNGRGALNYRIKPLDESQSAFVGPALTAHSAPADIVGMFGAVNEAQPGDVLVIANDAFTGTAVVGDLAIGMMKNKGIAAFVTDGLARDKAGILEFGMPVFCQGISPNSPGRTGLGIVGAPISLGDVFVKPGDIMIGDADAVVVVAQEEAEEVAQRLAEIQESEKIAVQRVADGATLPASMADMIENALIIEDDG